MERPRLSIAMCTYNGARYVLEELVDIAAQTRLPDELVVCDDGSTDGTIEIIESFVRHSRFAVRLEVNDKNLGCTKNFEKAIRMCHGEIIVLADQDDLWHPHKLNCMARVFENEGIGAVFSDAWLIDENSQLLPQKLWKSFFFNSREQEKFDRGQGLKVLLKHSAVTGATMAFRSKFRELALPIPVKHIHDHWIALLIASVSQLAAIRTPLIRYRKHQAQLTGPGGGYNSLGQMVRIASVARRDEYFREVEQFSEVHERLCERSEAFRPHPNVLRLIGQKIDHRRARGSLPNSKFLRLPLLFREVVTQRYWRYSLGLGSFAKDLLV